MAVKCRACGSPTKEWGDVKGSERYKWHRCVKCDSFSSTATYNDLLPTYNLEMLLHHISFGWERLLAEQSENVKEWQAVLEPASEILDVGFLDGSAMVRLHELGHAVWGFDVTDYGIGWVQQKTGLPRKRFFVAPTLIAADLKSDRWDGIQCREVIEHVEHPDRLLREMARLLRRGGHIQVQTPAWTRGINDVWDQEQHLTCFDNVQLHAMMHDAGFEVIKNRTWDGGQLLVGRKR